MRFAHTVRLEQQQRLLVTPELRQALTVLQLPLMELEEYVAREVLANPMLELREDSEVFPSLDELPEPEWLEYFQDASDLGYLRCMDDERRTASDLLARAPTLAEHLTLQLLLSGADGEIRRACAFLIDSLDDNGYLTIDVASAAAALQMTESRVMQALSLLQSFDPPGVGARSLAECLLLQLTAHGETSPCLREIVCGHLADVAAGRLGRIAADLGVDIAEVRSAVDLIRSLNPKPGRSFSSGDEPRLIRPDAVIERVGDDYVVIVNDTLSPRLRISSYYRALLGRVGDPEAEHFLQAKLRSAVWLLRSIEQRRLTLYRVVDAVARFQRPFLAFGLRSLRPLTLRDVAQSLGLHESTVSRAVAHKYVQTPQGCYALRFFFGSGVGHTAGERHSAASIKQIIRELVAAEDPRAPLSDDQLTRLLAGMGIPIARRTVAKYRSEAGIESSHKRKQ